MATTTQCELSVGLNTQSIQAYSVNYLISAEPFVWLYNLPNNLKANIN